MNKPLAFEHHTYSYKSLFLFSSQILVCATAFATHYLFSFWDLHLLSSLSNKNKRVGRDIGTSLHMYQNQHDYCLIIHDKLKDRFTTITQRYKCKNNKLNSWMHKAICTKVQGQTHMWYVLKLIWSNFFEFFTFYMVLDFLLT